jgi:hypothetical protein
MTPHRTWGIAADEQRQELYLTVQDPGARHRLPEAGGQQRGAACASSKATPPELADPHGYRARHERNLMVDQQSREAGACTAAAGRP